MVFKTTAIDHSAIPPAFASVHHLAGYGEAGSAFASVHQPCLLGVARQSAVRRDGGRVEVARNSNWFIGFKHAQRAMCHRRGKSAAIDVEQDTAPPKPQCHSRIIEAS